MNARLPQAAMNAIGGATGAAALRGNLTAKAAACLVPIGTTIGEAAANAQVSIEASADVLGSLGVREESMPP